MFQLIKMRLTFSASKLVLALICGMQNRRELNALLSKLNRFLYLGNKMQTNKQNEKLFVMKNCHTFANQNGMHKTCKIEKQGNSDKMQTDKQTNKEIVCDMVQQPSFVCTYCRFFVFFVCMNFFFAFIFNLRIDEALQ